MRKILLALWVVGGTAAGFYIHARTPKAADVQKVVETGVPSTHVHKVNRIDFPSDMGTIEFFHLSYSSQEVCGAGCTLSHFCYLRKGEEVTPFHAIWANVAERPTFVGVSCDPITENSCQNFLKGTLFFQTKFKQFYTELTINEHPDFKECLSPDVKVRFKLLKSI